MPPDEPKLAVKRKRSTANHKTNGESAKNVHFVEDDEGQSDGGRSKVNTTAKVSFTSDTPTKGKKGKVAAAPQNVRNNEARSQMGPPLLQYGGENALQNGVPDGAQLEINFL